MFEEMITAMAQFGVAGLMGTLWVWERAMSRKREAQLTAAHECLLAERPQLQELLRLMRRHTRAVERFDQTQRQLQQVLQKVCDDRNQRAA